MIMTPRGHQHTCLSKVVSFCKWSVEATDGRCEHAFFHSDDRTTECMRSEAREETSEYEAALRMEEI